MQDPNMQPSAMAGGVGEAMGAEPSQADFTGGETNPEMMREAAGMPKKAGRRTPNVSKEQQQDYEKVVIAAKELLYSEGIGKHVVKISNKDPRNLPAGIGEATAQIMTQLYEASGREMPGRVVVPAAMEVMADIIDMNNAAKGQPMSNEDMAATAQATVGAVLKAFGATEQHIQSFMEKNSSKPGVKTALESQFKLHTDDGTPTPNINYGGAQ